MDTLEIIFGPSSSKSYRRALSLAKQCSGYSEAEGEHHITWNPKDADAIITLYSLIWNWKSVRVIVNGQVVRRPKVLISWMICYDQAKQGASCFVRNSVQDGAQFPFGCSGPGDLHFWKYAPWLRIGKLSGRVWLFDKPAIMCFVKEKLQDYRLCPKQRPEWLDAFLDVFPAAIDPAVDLLWSYQTRDGLALVSSLHVVIGAPQEDTPMDINEVVGVGPNDQMAAQEILNQLFTIVTLKHNINREG
jgi:hypothetical protein